jgi:penicillin-binding protein 1C
VCLRAAHPAFSTPTGDYCPENFDGTCYGPVRLRLALANSLNIPAVKTLASVGPQNLLDRLRECGFRGLDADATRYGLGLTLGDCEVSLLELAEGYSTLARLGMWKPVRFVSGGEVAGGTRVLDASACWLIADILSDDSARCLTFSPGGPLSLGFRFAAKTGTSVDFRDNWAVGYTPRHTVAVWAGNFDGKPMMNVSGITGAAPILREIIQRLYAGGDPGWFERPGEIVQARICSLSGALAGAGCAAPCVEKFKKGTEPTSACEWHMSGDCAISGETELRIAHPNSWDVILIDPEIPAEKQTLLLEVAGEPRGSKLSWFVDGELFAECQAPFSAHWPVLRGTHEIRAVDAAGESACVFLRVE